MGEKRSTILGIEIARLNLMLQVIHAENLYLIEKIGGYDVMEYVNKYIDKMDEIMKWDPRDGKEDTIQDREVSLSEVRRSNRSPEELLRVLRQESEDTSGEQEQG